MSLAQDSGEQVIVFADADTIAKGWGYNKRKAAIDKGMWDHGISFPYFLYPNNLDDGDVEMLMESAARRDAHTIFFDCFEATKGTRGEVKATVLIVKSSLLMEVRITI